MKIIPESELERRKAQHAFVKRRLQFNAQVNNGTAKHKGCGGKILKDLQRMRCLKTITEFAEVE